MTRWAATLANARRVISRWGREPASPGPLLRWPTDPSSPSAPQAWPGVTPEQVRLIMLPGLGGDARMFARQRGDFPRLETPDWMPAHDGETLAAYAQRFAERLSSTLDPAQPYAIGGISFGGMVALELAHRLTPAPVALLQIASCDSGRAVRAPLRGLYHAMRPLGRHVYRYPPVLARLMDSDLGELLTDERRVFCGMFADTDPLFLAWATGAILSWPGASAPPVPHLHVHGTADDILAPSRVRPTAWVPGAPHLVHHTHAPRVNAMIKEALRLALAGPN